MSTALCPLSAYFEPSTAPDDTRQCAAFPCRQPVYGRETRCEDHARQVEVDRGDELMRFFTEREEILSDLRRFKAELESTSTPAHKLGFAESVVDRWVGRLSA